MSLIFDAFATLISFFYGLVPNYAFAIVMLTVVVRLLLFPLTAKQARSMQAMQRVQPELKRLQAQYKNDRQKLNEELMKFYKENNINPLAGCLPLLLQLPLFIVLFRVIDGLTKTIVVGATVASVGVLTVPAADDPIRGVEIDDVRVDGGKVDGGVLVDGELKGTVVRNGDELGTLSDAEIADGQVPTATVRRGETTVGTLQAIRLEGGRVVGDPRYIPETTELHKDLRDDGGVMESFGIDLSENATSAQGGFGDVAPYWVLVALVAATGYYQQRQMTARNPQAAQNPQMQMMGKVFPVVFAFISLNIAAGVVIYFVVSNLWQIGQQALIFRHVAPPAAGAIDASSQERGPKGGGNRPAKAPKPRPATPKVDRPRSGRVTDPRTPPRSGRRKGRR